LQASVVPIQNFKQPRRNQAVIPGRERSERARNL
jgi:hypothetical protein